MCEKVISGVLDERERRLADGAAVWARRACASEGEARLAWPRLYDVCLDRPAQVAPLDEAVRAAYASFEGFAPQDPLLLSAYFNVLNSFIPHLVRNPTLLRGYVEKVYGYAAYAQPGEGVTAAGRFEGSETSQVVRRTACHNWLKLCMCAADTLLVCVISCPGITGSWGGGGCVIRHGGFPWSMQPTLDYLMQVEAEQWAAGALGWGERACIWEGLVIIRYTPSLGAQLFGAAHSW
jgi:hypothetical protein